MFLEELPLAVREVNPVEKLLWLWIYLHGEGEYSATKVANSLGTTRPSISRALTKLIEMNLIQEISIARGSRLGQYKALG